MFDIGFWELMVVAVIALLVVGPDKLPGLVRTTGLWVGRIRRFAASVKDEIDEEVARSDELKRLMDEQIEIRKRHEETEQQGRSTVPVGARARGDDDAQHSDEPKARDEHSKARNEPAD